MQPLLFRSAAHDPMVIGTVALTLVVVATLAGAVPGLRARRIAPVEALRYE